MHGGVDNILVNGKKLIVLDYKTRGYALKEDTAEHYRLQQNVYNFLLRKNGFKIENYAYLLFYHPDRVGTEGEILFHTDLVERSISTANAEKIIKNALKTLGGSIPESPEECEFCRWREQR